MASKTKKRSEFFRVAVEGATTDGRVIERQQIADIANKHGANVTEGQLGENTYRPMVNVMSRESINNGVAGTPTIFIDGKRYEEGNFQDALKKAVDEKK